MIARAYPRSERLAPHKMQDERASHTLQPTALVLCVEQFSNEHLAQCINYLKASGLHLALLINFRHPKVELRRIVHNL